MHCTVPAAEKILDKEFPVLDHGFVRLVDYLGSDERIVQAARVSYGKGTKTVREDKGLIDYLMRNDHTSPFEQVNFTFHLKMPIFVARQWVRHRTGRMNEISGRYSIMNDECYIPAAENICMQSTSNRQGRGDTMENALAESIRLKLKDEQEKIFQNYHDMLDMGLAKEIARIDLPLGLYTEFYWQMDLHNLLHFLGLRMEGHAQWEIREYANVLFDIVKTVCPMAAEAFENNKLRGATLNGKEKAIFKELFEKADKDALKASGATDRTLRILGEKLSD